MTTVKRWETLGAAGMTDVGKKRGHNEDSFMVDREIALLMVADGVGGQDAGEIASRTAVEVVSDFLYEYDPELIAAEQKIEQGAPEATVQYLPSIAPTVVQSAVTNANRHIYQLNRIRGYDEGSGMGTTIAGIWMQEDAPRAAIFHVGDSRVYRLRGGELTQMTRDHSLYQQWLDAGAEGDPPGKNVITRALGPFAEVLVDVQEETVLAGDTFMACSDGLTGMIDDDVIKNVMETIPEPNACCAELIRLANENGGKDNISVVIARLG